MALALLLLLACSTTAAGALLVLILQRRAQLGQLDQEEQTRCLKCKRSASACRCGEEEREGWIRERWWKLKPED